VELSFNDREAVLRAKLVLEHPGLAAMIANVIGRPIEAGLAGLPSAVQRAIGVATSAALRVALHAAVSTLPDQPASSASPRLHALAAGLTGAAGGFFGLIALPAELPICTVIMLRSIADVARSHGEDMQTMEARLSCLTVLGLGSPDQRGADHNAETGYYAARIGLAQSVSQAAEHMAKHGVSKKLAPPVAELLTRVAGRFSIRVSEEFVAKAIPVVGAATGAAINTLFVHHFQELAQAHFTIRRLERRYGATHVRGAYDSVRWSGPPVSV
jgi:hypothetical protein